MSIDGNRKMDGSRISRIADLRLAAAVQAILISVLVLITARKGAVRAGAA